MPEADKLPPLREVIAAHGLAAKKSLGQNFLLDLNLTRRIARAAGANEGGVFYEVGPGPGGLTRALLAEGADKVIAVERDARCLPALEEIAARLAGQTGDHLRRCDGDGRSRAVAARRAHRRQPALQCRHGAADQMADRPSMAAVLGKAPP